MLTWSPCSAWSMNTSARYTVRLPPLEVVATHCSLCLLSAPPTHQPGAIGGNHDGRSQQRHLGHHVRARAAPLTPLFAAFGRTLRSTTRALPCRPVYERELESPIKNALFGDLLSLLLIQVHKAKVDVARAMLALDKLMRANGANHTHHTHRPCVLLILGDRGGVMQSSIFSCSRSRPPFCWSAA
jgi:hypothetical protein